MHYTFVHVKLSSDNVEVLSIASVVATENRISNMIRELNHSRRLGINEERRIRKIVNASPLRAKYAKVSRHLLKRCFVRTFVEDN